MTALDASAVVGVVGAGTMGAGIAQVAAAAGHDVLLYDAVAGAAGRGLDAITRALTRQVERGRLTGDEADALRRRIRVVDSVPNLAPATMIIEAILESLSVKQRLFTDLEAVVAPDAVLASNTSSLSITDIAQPLSRPQRLVGMHFFNPAPVLRLVEVISGGTTDPSVADLVADTAARWGKTPVRAASTPGFIVNRVARPFYLEPFRAYEAGIADAATIDALFRESAGFAMGPFELTDLIGQDINAAVSQSVYEAFDEDPRFEPSGGQRALVTAGKLGRKAGAGWYAYDVDRPEASTVPTERAPATVVARGLGGPLAGLVDRIAAVGIAVDQHPSSGSTEIELPSGGVLRATVGRAATAPTHPGAPPPEVLLDLADFTIATRVGIGFSVGCPNVARAEAIGLLQAGGVSVSVLANTPGLVVARTLAMLVNLAADAVDCGVATAADVDLAMVAGVSYPRGPLAWGDAIGLPYVVEVLDNLAGLPDPDAGERYRVSPLLRRCAEAGTPVAAI